MFFISEVFAEEVANSTTTAPNIQGFINNIIPLLIFIAVFYLLLIRPQQKKQQEHEKEVSSLKPNDKVLTAGGIYAKIVKIKEKTIILEIANDVEIEVIPDTVTPIKDEKEEVNKKVKKSK